MRSPAILATPSGPNCSNTLGERLADASKRGEATVLDLRELDFIDSSGLRLLLSAQGRRRTRRLEGVDRDPPPAVLRLFEITGALNRFSMRDS